MGSVLLLACISGAVASAWVGGTGAWVEVNVMSVLNATLAGGRGGPGFFGNGQMPEGMLRSLLCKLGQLPVGPTGECDEYDGPEQNEL